MLAWIKSIYKMVCLISHILSGREERKKGKKEILVISERNNILLTNMLIGILGCWNCG